MLSASTRWYFPAMWLRTEPFVPNMHAEEGDEADAGGAEGGEELDLGAHRGRTVVAVDTSRPSCG